MKKRISIGGSVALIFSALLSQPGAGHQDKNQVSTQNALQGVPDRFIGVWKLRVDKTPNAGTFSEVITIEGQGKSYKFTYDQSFGNGTENHLWYVTEMKGEIVADTHMNGQRVPGKSRITRIDSGSFRVEGEIQKDVYKVSADSQTMKLERTYSVQTRPNALHDVSLVFDRQR